MTFSHSIDVSTSVAVDVPVDPAHRSSMRCLVSLPLLLVAALCWLGASTAYGFDLDVSAGPYTGQSSIVVSSPAQYGNAAAVRVFGFASGATLPKQIRFLVAPTGILQFMIPSNASNATVAVAGVNQPNCAVMVLGEDDGQLTIDGAIGTSILITNSVLNNVTVSLDGRGTNLTILDSVCVGSGVAAGTAINKGVITVHTNTSYDVCVHVANVTIRQQSDWPTLVLLSGTYLNAARVRLYKIQYTEKLTTPRVRSAFRGISVEGFISFAPQSPGLEILQNQIWADSTGSAWTSSSTTSLYMDATFVGLPEFDAKIVISSNRFIGNDQMAYKAIDFTGTIVRCGLEMEFNELVDAGTTAPIVLPRTMAIAARTLVTLRCNVSNATYFNHNYNLYTMDKWSRTTSKPIVAFNASLGGGDDLMFRQVNISANTITTVSDPAAKNVSEAAFKLSDHGIILTAVGNWNGPVQVLFSGNVITSTTGIAIVKPPPASALAQNTAAVVAMWMTNNTIRSSCLGIALADIAAFSIASLLLATNTIATHCNCNALLAVGLPHSWPFMNGGLGNVSAYTVAWTAGIYFGQRAAVTAASIVDFPTNLTVTGNTVNLVCNPATDKTRPVAMGGVVLYPLDGTRYASILVEGNTVTATSPAAGCGLPRSYVAIGLANSDSAPASVISAEGISFASVKSNRIVVADSANLKSVQSDLNGIAVLPLTVAAANIEITNNSLDISRDRSAALNNFDGSARGGRGIYMNVTRATTITLDRNTINIHGGGLFAGRAVHIPSAQFGDMAAAFSTGRRGRVFISNSKIQITVAYLPIGVVLHAALMDLDIVNVQVEQRFATLYNNDPMYFAEQAQGVDLTVTLGSTMVRDSGFQVGAVSCASALPSCSSNATASAAVFWAAIVQGQHFDNSQIHTVTYRNVSVSGLGGGNLIVGACTGVSVSSIGVARTTFDNNRVKMTASSYGVGLFFNNTATNETYVFNNQVSVSSSYKTLRQGALIVLTVAQSLLDVRGNDVTQTYRDDNGPPLSEDDPNVALVIFGAGADAVLFVGSTNVVFNTVKIVGSKATSRGFCHSIFIGNYSGASVTVAHNVVRVEASPMADGIALASGMAFDNVTIYNNTLTIIPKVYVGQTAVLTPYHRGIDVGWVVRGVFPVPAVGITVLRLLNVSRNNVLICGAWAVSSGCPQGNLNTLRLIPGALNGVLITQTQNTTTGDVVLEGNWIIILDHGGNHSANAAVHIAGAASKFVLLGSLTVTKQTIRVTAGICPALLSVTAAVFGDAGNNATFGSLGLSSMCLTIGPSAAFNATAIDFQTLVISTVQSVSELLDDFYSGARTTHMYTVAGDSSSRLTNGSLWMSTIGIAVVSVASQITVVDARGGNVTLQDAEVGVYAITGSSRRRSLSATGLSVASLAHANISIRGWKFTVDAADVSCPVLAVTCAASCGNVELSDITITAAFYDVPANTEPFSVISISDGEMSTLTVASNILYVASPRLGPLRGSASAWAVRLTAVTVHGDATIFNNTIDVERVTTGGAVLVTTSTFDRALNATANKITLVYYGGGGAPAPSLVCVGLVSCDVNGDFIFEGNNLQMLFVARLSPTADGAFGIAGLQGTVHVARSSTIRGNAVLLPLAPNTTGIALHPRNSSRRWGAPVSIVSNDITITDTSDAVLAWAQGITFTPQAANVELADNTIDINTPAWDVTGVRIQRADHLNVTANGVSIRCRTSAFLSPSSRSVIGLLVDTVAGMVNITANTVAVENQRVELAYRRVRAVSLCQSGATCSLTALHIIGNSLSAVQVNPRSPQLYALCVCCEGDSVGSMMDASAGEADFLRLQDNTFESGSVSIGTVSLGTVETSAAKNYRFLVRNMTVRNGTLAFHPVSAGTSNLTYILTNVSTYYRGDQHRTAFDAHLFNMSTSTVSITNCSFEIIHTDLSNAPRGIDLVSGTTAANLPSVAIYIADTIVRVTTAVREAANVTEVVAYGIRASYSTNATTTMLLRSVDVVVRQEQFQWVADAKSPTAIGLDFRGPVTRLQLESIDSEVVLPAVMPRLMIMTDIRVTVQAVNNTAYGVILTTAEATTDANAVAFVPISNSQLSCSSSFAGGLCLVVTVADGTFANVTFANITIETGSVISMRAIDFSSASLLGVATFSDLNVRASGLPWKPVDTVLLNLSSAGAVRLSNIDVTDTCSSALGLVLVRVTLAIQAETVVIDNATVIAEVDGLMSLQVIQVTGGTVTLQDVTVSANERLKAATAYVNAVNVGAYALLNVHRARLSCWSFGVEGDCLLAHDAAPTSKVVLRAVEVLANCSVGASKIVEVHQYWFCAALRTNASIVDIDNSTLTASGNSMLLTAPVMAGYFTTANVTRSVLVVEAAPDRFGAVEPVVPFTSVPLPYFIIVYRPFVSPAPLYTGRVNLYQVAMLDAPGSLTAAYISTDTSQNVTYNGASAFIVSPASTATLQCVEFRRRLLDERGFNASQPLLAPLATTIRVPACAGCLDPLPPLLRGCVSVTATHSQSRSTSDTADTASRSVAITRSTVSASDTASPSAASRSASRSFVPSLSTSLSTSTTPSKMTLTQILTTTLTETATNTPTPPPTPSSSIASSISASLTTTRTLTTSYSATASTTITDGSQTASGSRTSPPTPSASLSVSASQLTPTHTQQLTASHSAGSATITATDRTPTASSTINIADYAFAASAPRSLNLRTLMYGSDPALDPLRSPLVVALHIPAGAHGWRGAHGDLMRAPPGLRCTATIDSVSPTMADLADLAQWMAEKALGLRVGEHALDNLRGRIALTLYRIQTVQLATTSGGGMAITVPYEPFSEANATSDAGTPDLLLDRAIEVRFAVDASCFATDRPAALPASVNATLLEIVDVPPRVPPVLLPPSAVATSVVTSAMSGAMGSPTGATVASRSMLVASLRDCETELGDPLPVDANPTRVWIGDADVRYHYGAAVMNAVLLLTCGALQVVVALLKMTATRRSANTPSVLFDQLLTLLNAVLGDDDDDEDEGDEHANVEATKVVVKSAMTPGGGGIHGIGSQGSQGMRAIRRHVRRKRAKARLTATLPGALRWARFPSLLVFPLMFLFQPIVQSSFVLVVYGDDTSGRVVGVALLLSTAGFVGWTFWRLRVARFPAKFVRPSRLEKHALHTEWQNILSQERGGLLSFAALRHQFILLFRSRGDWKDTSASSESLFVRANFLFVADYTDRCRWNILVEFGFSAALGVVGAMVEAGGCTGVDWVVLVLFTAYMAALLFLRGFESRFNFGFTLFVGAVQWLSTILAIAARYTENRAIDAAAEVLLMIAIFTSSARAVHDILHTGMYIARRQGAAIFDFHRKRLQRLREANWELLLQAGGTGLPAGQSAKLMALAKQALTEAELRKMLLHEDGASWVEDTALEVAVLEQLDDAAVEPLDAVLTIPLCVVADPPVLHEPADAKSGDRQRQRQKSTAQMPTARADLGERSAVLARGNAIIDGVELEMDIIRQQHPSHSQSIESANTTSNQAAVTHRRAVPAIHYDAAAAQRRSQARNLFVDPNSAEGREKTAKWRELIDAL
jgi:hypothetical protein